MDFSTAPYERGEESSSSLKSSSSVAEKAKGVDLSIQAPPLPRHAEGVSLFTPLSRSKKRSERYESGGKLGAGTYGTVVKAVDRETDTTVAVKRVKLSKEGATLSEDKASRHCVGDFGFHFTTLREIKIMREVDHPNVMRLRDVYVEGEFVNLVMDFMYTDLKKFLAARPTLSEAHIKCLALQILRGLAEMHEWYFLHRDLAPANIFIDSRGVAKIGDFGLARSHGSPGRMHTPTVVTIWYRSPELLYGTKFYSDKVDTWSFGCVLAELIRGKALFDGKGEVDQLAKIFEILGTPTEKNWPGVKCLPRYCEFSACEGKGIASFIGSAASSSAVDLIENLLQLDPRKRLSAEEALRHPFFSEPPHPCPPEHLPLP